MASAATITGIILIVALVGIGITQTVFDHMPEINFPRSELVAAVTAQEPIIQGPTQQEINLCMNACMNGCVVNPGDEPSCLTGCNAQCGAE